MATRFSDRTFAAPLDAALDRQLRAVHEGASWNEVRRLIETGKVQVDGALVTDSAAPVRAGAEVRLTLAAPRRTAQAPLDRDAIVHLDGHVVVVDKPSGMSTVPYDGDEFGTLVQVLQPLLRKLTGQRGDQGLGVVHRIDKETSGLVVFTRTLAAKRALEAQFRNHTAHRRYVAIAHGDVAARTLRSNLVADRGDGLRGSTREPGVGQPSVTHVAPLQRLRGATLVECRLETGRTHQIRVHLSEAGHPLLGERVYVRDFGRVVLPAPRVMLHAAELGFAHPAGERPLSFSRQPPRDFVACARALGGRL